MNDKYIIAIDGGTTNTRLTLLKNGSCVDKLKCRVGARDGSRTVSAELSPIALAVKSGIGELLNRNSLTESDIRHIALSGMIGSESGLCEIAHIIAPAGIDELRDSLVIRSLPEISPLPFVFIPGVRTFTDVSGKSVGIEELSTLDIMRGEETELVGIAASLKGDFSLNNTSSKDDRTQQSGSKIPSGCKITAVMPGSHMKIVELDEHGRITAFRTSISGELSRAAAENTILSHSLGDAFPKLADERYLKLGFEYAQAHGIGEALFKVRVQANFIKTASPEQLYAFLLGAILRDDVNSILESGNIVVIAGSDPFRLALACLLENKARIFVLDDSLSENAAAIGAWLITGECQL